ncbi:6-pyruvoyl tetrahydrobiopterin synthase [Acidisarcina polymorpha]|uniref:6-carboxy-5,6,7,8-tetrahydropterin synthase n=1 Tax=Acidisarcina polymorpha TaxID=2211140 RepID=A0A2Z5G7B0_9BACT|nr:6-pyruvoyl tetrahydrobiopterin synthase [Acidisarcina polymorpha]
MEVTTGGQVDAQTGMVCDLVKLDDAVRKNVVERFDLTNLNLDECFRKLVPTTENLCIAIHERLMPVFQSGVLGQVDLVRVRVEETANNFFEFTGK